MEILSENERRIPVEQLNTSSALAHARAQAAARNLDDMLIVDVDSHHYESENYGDFLTFMEDPVPQFIPTPYKSVQQEIAYNPEYACQVRDK